MDSIIIRPIAQIKCAIKSQKANFLNRSSPRDPGQTNNSAKIKSAMKNQRGSFLNHSSPRDPGKTNKSKKLIRRTTKTSSNNLIDYSNEISMHYNPNNNHEQLGRRTYFPSAANKGERKGSV